MAEELDIVSKYMKNPPVNLQAIFDELGIDYREDWIDESGYIEENSGGYQVVVNATEGAQRRRFTAAHELAHFLLHRPLLRASRAHRHTDRLFGDDAKNNDESPFGPEHETQANKLAAQILMPAGQIKGLYNSATDNVAELARTFEVSQAAMRVRLKSLGLRETVTP